MCKMVCSPKLNPHHNALLVDDLQCLGIETVPDRDLATMDDLVDDVDRPVQVHGRVEASVFG